MILYSSTIINPYQSYHSFLNCLIDSCSWCFSIKSKSPLGLFDLIEKHQLLYQYQFGFWKNHSTFMALVILLEKITAALDDSEFAVCIWIDFRKAFDTTEHSILLDKLYHYGIRGNALKWFNSYLTNRYQYVNYNNTQSDIKQLISGIPQGSILGPLLFLIT